jgi:transcriptional regulator with XRE-family HTH domain
VDLGRRLREARKRRSLSLYDVGERMGLHFSTIAKYERGERRPDLQVLRELAAVYEVPLTELIGDEESAAAAFPPGLRAAALELIRRHDLQSLLDVGCRLRPEQVIGLVGFLRTITPPVGGAGAEAGRPEP